MDDVWLKMLLYLSSLLLLNIQLVNVELDADELVFNQPDKNRAGDVVYMILFESV